MHPRTSPARHQHKHPAMPLYATSLIDSLQCAQLGLSLAGPGALFPSLSPTPARPMLPEMLSDSTPCPWHNYSTPTCRTRLLLAACLPTSVAMQRRRPRNAPNDIGAPRSRFNADQNSCRTNHLAEIAAVHRCSSFLPGVSTTHHHVAASLTCQSAGASLTRG